VAFITITVRVSLNLSYFNNMFLLRNNGDFYVNVYIISRENSCKFDRASYGVRLIFYISGRAPYDIVPGTGRCFHIQTPDGACTICYHAREHS